MRILHVGKYYSPVHGGMERVLKELCEGLAHQGHDVCAVAASADGASGRARINAVDVIRLRTYGRLLSQPLITGLKSAIASFQPEIIHFHLPNPLALSQGWPRDIATCLTLHADAGGLKRPLDRWWTKRFASQADAVVFSSAIMAEKWRSVIASGRSHVIPFGFRFDYLQRAEEARDSKLILFVGRLVGYKGIDVLLRAMSRVNAKLAIVGDGPQRRSLERLALRHGIAERVQFVGAVTDQSLSRWYERAWIYVQPSINECEAFGISMLEAMQMARPVVSTDLSTGVQAVNRHGQTGLVVPPRDPIALAAALNTLLRDQELALRLGMNAQKFQQKFSVHAMIDRHLALYESLVEAGPGRDIFREPSVDIHSEISV